LRRYRPEQENRRNRRFLEEMKLVSRNPAFLFLLGGLGFAGFAITGLVQWLPSYFARSFALSMREIGTSFGLVYGLGSMCGIFFGGMIASPLFERDQRWALWIPIGAYIFAFPLLIIAIFTASFPLAMGCLFIGFAILTCGFGPVYALVQNIVPPDMRALAHGAENPLRVGVLAGMSFFPFPAILYFLGSRRLAPKPEPHIMSGEAV
jgi:hypothetical protein